LLLFRINKFSAFDSSVDLVKLKLPVISVFRPMIIILP